MELIFDKYKPTQVIHLAALVGGLYKNMSQEADFFRDNIMINNNIIDVAHKHKVHKLVACLSTCIFPDNVKLPFDESSIHLGPPHSSNYGYAYAKRMVDIQCRYWLLWFPEPTMNNMEITLPRSFLQTYLALMTTLICKTRTSFPAWCTNVCWQKVLLINHVIDCLGAGKQFVVKGTGKPLRQFIYSRDLARLMIWALREYPEIEPILLSVGAEDEVSIKQAAEMIAKQMDYESKLIFDPTQADGQFRKTANNRKLRNYLPDFKFTSFEEGKQKDEPLLV